MWSELAPWRSHSPRVVMGGTLRVTTDIWARPTAVRLARGPRDGFGGITTVRPAQVVPCRYP